ncbi:hypothetical protein VTO73DRAFT_13098 [Trametes versicolor]
MGFSIGGDLPTTSSSSSRNGRAYLHAIGVRFTLPVCDIQTIACSRDREARMSASGLARISPDTSHFEGRCVARRAVRRRIVQLLHVLRANRSESEKLLGRPGQGGRGPAKTSSFDAPFHRRLVYRLQVGKHPGVVLAYRVCAFALWNNLPL